MFLLQNQEINRCLNYTHPIIQQDSALQDAYMEMRQFLHTYTLHMSKLVESQLAPYDAPDKMLESFHNINKFTIGYCVLFHKK